MDLERLATEDLVALAVDLDREAWRCRTMKARVLDILARREQDAEQAQAREQATHVEPQEGG